MKIGVLGSGVVGQTLAVGFLKHGHQVMVGTRDTEKLEDWKRQHKGALLGSFREATVFGESIVLAVNGGASRKALSLAGAENLSGKLVIDATNPIAELPPENGVLRFFTNLDDSLMEQLQREFPGARLVKAFNSVGAHNFFNPVFEGGRPTMFICGNDEAAKQTVVQLLDQAGWESADMGAVTAARAIEPLSMLWCIPGFLHNEWTHAFKLMRG